MKYRKPVKASAAVGLTPQPIEVPSFASRCNEECFKLKSKFLILILAGISAALMPLSAVSQLAKEKPRSQGGPPAYKWEAFAMAGYTSLNQVNQSRYGLIGGKAGVTRDFSKHFGLTGIGSYYKPSAGSGGGGNPGDPSVYDVMAGPSFAPTSMATSTASSTACSALSTLAAST